jgi:hypothetical protein
MRKMFLVALVALASIAPAAATAQERTWKNASDEAPNMGRAPQQPDGIGRLDLRVVDEHGNPVEGVRAHLESKRSGGQFCESWNFTNARGVAVLPPLHMGRLTLTLKAKGFATQKLNVLATDLGQPVRVTMVRK